MKSSLNIFHIVEIIRQVASYTLLWEIHVGVITHQVASLGLFLFNISYNIIANSYSGT